jgi:dTDP-4-dehydrorhamnose 3,5-epimerase
VSGRFDVRDTPLGGVCVLHRHPVGDNRGFLERLFCDEELKPLIGERRIRQVNLTMTARRGTIRGMHFQYPPSAEMKFVTCISGSIFDVAVDLRRNSPTFLRWHGEVLSDDSHSALVIPEGCAHGFQTLTDDCEILYLHTAPYAAAAEAGVHPRDPRLAIAWPETVTELSARDNSHAMLRDDFEGMVL